MSTITNVCMKNKRNIAGFCEEDIFHLSYILNDLDT